MKLLACGTAFVTLAAGIVFFVAGNIWLSSISIVQSIALAVGIFTPRVLLERVTGLTLLVMLIVLGFAWPSIFTVLAVLAVPAIVLGAMNLLVWSTRPRGTTYIGVACFLAACSMLAQATHLAG
jgi:hypothetical protein